ncbi:MAG: CinA family protein [Promethearchaeota archaeon]
MPFNIDKKISDLAQIILTDLKMKELTLGTAESATGGFLSHTITNIPGSSKNYLGGVVCYSAEAKNVFLDVDFDVINSFGAISEETTVALLNGVRNKLGSDLAVAITGVLGTQMEGKPTGLVYIGIGSRIYNNVFDFQFTGSRLSIKKQTIRKALQLLFKEIEKM